MLRYWTFGAFLLTTLVGACCAWADGPLDADATVGKLKLYGDLQAQVFAAEPMITNPTNITVDARGRVWICDVVNYRGNQGKRPEGDRILVLEDEDGDGRADRSTVFYEGPDVDSALGICVLDEKVIVSCSPDVFILTDEDGDGRADKKEILYTKTGEKQHDHSAHAFLFGPDGCLYWNLGNHCQGVFDRDGNPVVDMYGRKVLVNGKPYRHGMAFRQSFDGSEFEVLAHNLRNSYELAVDSFGDVWFTDNDDDGHRGTRLCFTLNGGNYGYTDEMTGASWRGRQWTGMSDEGPLRHWHQNDPGSVPNVLNLGSGSPSGVEVYEGNLLPGELRGGIVHCEPGHNVVRVYRAKPEAGGFTAETVELIDGRGDPWFRPVDSATAPDGSLMIADWYDPGVGGHHQADSDRGRIYRVAPPNSPYVATSFDLTDHEQACQALCSGNNSVRYAAWTALDEAGSEAEAALSMLSTSDDPQSRARAFWLLTRLPDTGGQHLTRAASDTDARVRAAAARMTKHVDLATAEQVLGTLANDPSPQVRRAVTIELRRYHQQPFASQLWATLALQFDGSDRWQLEALGLAAEFDWDRYLEAWLAAGGEAVWRTSAGRMIVWRSRGKQTLQRLVDLLADRNTPDDEIIRLLRAIDFNKANDRDALLVGLTETALQFDVERQRLIATEVLRRVSDDRLSDSRLLKVVAQLLEDLPHDDEYAKLVIRFKQRDHYEHLFEMAMGALADSDRGIQLLRFLVKQDYVDALRTKLESRDSAASTLGRMLGRTGETPALQLLMPLVNDTSANIDDRREAVRAMAANQQQAKHLVKLAEQDKLEQSMQTALLFALRTTPWTALTQRVEKLLPGLAASGAEKLPVAKWMKVNGRWWEGKKVFTGKANCSTCHKVGDVGKEVGPALTEIGSKLSRTGLYESILFPSAAVSHNYESYIAVTDEGLAITGVLIGETDDTVTLKTDKAVVHELRRDELEGLKKSEVSLMPSGNHKLMTPQQLADLVAYLQTLKKKP